MKHSHYQNWSLKDVMKKTREELIGYLVWNDSNGIWSDEDTSEEGIPKTSLAAARDAVFQSLVVNNDLAKIGGKVTFDQLVSAYVRTAADEIIVDFKNNIIKKSAKSFSDLHDYTDANLYGGAAFILALYGGESDLQDALDVLNMGQTILDIWLSLDRPHSF